MFSKAALQLGGVKNPHLKCIPTRADAVNFADITVLCLLGKVVFFFLFLFF